MLLNLTELNIVFDSDFGEDFNRLIFDAFGDIIFMNMTILLRSFKIKWAN